jgi:predicted RNA-binding protein associated with RNAse of E/G family
MSFSEGQEIQIREMVGEKPWAIRTVQVVQSSQNHTVVWMREGSNFRITEGYLNNPSFREERWAISDTGNWKMIDSEWKNNHVLIYKELDSFYSIQLFWRAKDEKFLGYYVNFDLPYRKVKTGYDTLDLELDIMVYPDMKTELKDEEDYLKAVESGHISTEWAGKIDKAKTSIYAAIKNRQVPFDGSLLDLRPC